MSIISKFKTALLKDEYPYHSQWGDDIFMRFYNEMIAENVILEFVLRTIPLDKLKRQFYKELGNNDYLLADSKGGEKIFISFLGSDPDILKSQVKKVNDFMDKMGWFPASTVSKEKYSSNIEHYINKGDVEIYYEGKFDTKIIPQEDIGYHITPLIRLDKIEEIGLTPKSGGKLSDHPDRVYLYIGENYKDVHKLASLMKSKELDKTKDKIYDYVLLEIDISSIKNRINFYKDPNFPNAIWTNEPIPPKYIKESSRFPIP